MLQSKYLRVLYESGVKSEVENSWREIEQSVRATAKISGLGPKALGLIETSPRGIATSSHVDLATGRLVGERGEPYRSSPGFRHYGDT